MADNNVNELREIQSLSRSIAKSYEDMAASSDKRNKKIQQEADITKQILSTLNDEESVKKAILELEKRGVSIKSTDYGINNKLKDTLIQTNSLASQSLNIRLQEVQVIGKVKAAADDVGESMKSTLGSIQSMVGDIPLIGGALQKLTSGGFEKMNSAIDRGVRGFGVGFERGFRNASNTGASFTKSVTGGLSKGFKFASGSMKSMMASLSGPQIVITAIVAGLALGVKRFQELEKAAENFRAETGLLNSQTRQLQTNIQQVSGTMAGLGVSAEDVSKAASDFTNEFSGLEQPSKAVLGSMVALNKNFGVGTKEAAQLNKVFQNIGGLSATQSQALIGQTAEMAKMAGVAPSKVIADLANNSEVAYQFFGGSATELAKAAVEAAALGTSITEAGKAARGLLDYENSITKELEASAILGTNINLSQSRYLAANGDILGSQQAILDEVGKLGDITKLNVFEQEALVEATGMEFSSLVNQQRIRERFGKLKKEELAAANSLLDSGKDLSKLTRADLEAQTQRLKGQQELQSQTSRFSNAMSGIGTAFMDMLAPIAGFLMPILADIGEVLNNVISPIFRVIGSVIGVILNLLGFVFDAVFAIIKPIAQFAGYLIDGIATPFNSIIEKLNQFRSFLTELGQSIYENVIEPFSRAAAIGGSIASTLTFGMLGSSSEESGASVTSVNDAVISPSGEVISTHPDDFLIATKTPETLGGGGPSVNMSGVINELVSLKEAFLTNKDVYMDTDKVTAAVTMRQESNSRNQFGMGNA